ncbi:hypothetical protein C8Q78DRAFT_983472 [Trametes maxima]|nr:hypothetical protein C8Q78DRAFT_983472 [Trametes maxima]
MPFVVAEKQYDEYNTRTVRCKLGVPLRKRRIAGNEDLEDAGVYRVLRLLVTERLMPLHTLTGEAFVTAWFQCTEVHYLNWQNHIHHKDPSLNNLMYRVRDGIVLGVLNDWDLAFDASCPHTHTGFEPVTGTIPFMAIELLTTEALSGCVRHLYRHDLEAMFWVYIWVVCCYGNGKRLEPLPAKFAEWTTGDVTECRQSKEDLLARGWEGYEPDKTWETESALSDHMLLHMTERFSAQAMVLARSRFAHRVSSLDQDDDPARHWQMYTKMLRKAGSDTPGLHYILDII